MDDDVKNQARRRPGRLEGEMNWFDFLFYFCIILACLYLIVDTALAWLDRLSWRIWGW